MIATIMSLITTVLLSGSGYVITVHLVGKHLAKHAPPPKPQPVRHRVYPRRRPR